MTAGWVVELRGQVGALDVDVAFESGSDPLVVIGPNGSGKTTLLRAIAGAATGLSGRVELCGRALMGLPPEERRIGYVPQGYALFPHLTALDNVAFACDPAKARAILERLDAAHLAGQRPHTLSGGERQRIALARALAADPVGLVLDEPLAALDVGRRRKMREFLARSLGEASKPAIVVTHDVRDVFALNGRVVVVEDGRVAEAGTASELAQSPATEFVAEFFELGPRA